MDAAVLLDFLVAMCCNVLHFDDFLLPIGIELCWCRCFQAAKTQKTLSTWLWQNSLLVVLFAFALSLAGRFCLLILALAKEFCLIFLSVT